jgi:hypothetical protein
VLVLGAYLYFVRDGDHVRDVVRFMFVVKNFEKYRFLDC